MSWMKKWSSVSMNLIHWEVAATNSRIYEFIQLNLRHKLCQVYNGKVSKNIKCLNGLFIIEAQIDRFSKNETSGVGTKWCCPCWKWRFYLFRDVSNVIHVDKKWFYVDRIDRRIQYLPGEKITTSIWLAKGQEKVGTLSSSHHRHSHRISTFSTFACFTACNEHLM
jgi:hypothetical protein